MQSHVRITSVLVTGKCEARFKLAKHAVNRWQQQLFSSRHELLVINDHPTISLFGPTFTAPSNAREIRLPERMSLGELRNIGIEKAETEYLLQWDDDDHSNNGRLLWQQEHTDHGTASVLRYEIHCDVSNGEAFVNDGHSIRGGGFPGTMMWPRDAKTRFPAIGKREDMEFVLALKNECGLQVLKNDPIMYCRLFHGDNTWGRQHVMHRKPGARKLSQDEQRYVQQMLMQVRTAREADGCVETP